MKYTYSAVPGFRVFCMFCGLTSCLADSFPRKAVDTIARGANADEHDEALEQRSECCEGFAVIDRKI